MDVGFPKDRDSCWLALNRIRGIRPQALAALVEHFGGPSELFAATDRQLEGVGVPAHVLRCLRRPDLEGAARDRAWLREPGRSLVACDAGNYPRILRATAAPPLVLFVEGDPGLLGRPGIAIVGSRNATPDGLETAAALAGGLARAGLTVVSGLARGIDAAAHRGALPAPASTVAVMATGPESVYPRAHAQLARSIAAAGALVTEFPVGTPVRPANFPRRNRIISGLALGVLVVEAARRSGSLVSARHALEEGREVFAVPGSIRNPQASGCHALLRDGAILVETVADVLTHVAPQLAVPAAAPQSPAARVAPAQVSDARARTLLECLGYERVGIDVLVNRSGLTAPEVSSILLKLELHGVVRSHPGGTFGRCRAEEKQ